VGRFYVHSEGIPHQQVRIVAFLDANDVILPLITSNRALPKRFIKIQPLAKQILGRIDYQELSIAQSTFDSE
jgi:hypothetical protein